MPYTTYSSQEVLNVLYGTAKTTHSEQGVVNLQNGSRVTQYSFQEILNTNLGVAPTFYSEQEALWLTLQADLGLTGYRTQYSVQQLLNMAYDNGGVTVPEILDDNPVGSFNEALLLAVA